jgi:hypothetical protein
LTVEQVIGLAKVELGGGKLHVYPRGWLLSIVDNRFSEGATVEIVCRLVPQEKAQPSLKCDCDSRYAHHCHSGTPHPLRGKEEPK